MDELLKDFLTETNEHIEGAENQLVQFERNPTDAALLASIFRLLHTIKGTSSFLGLVRLEHVAHAAESVISKLRDGAAPTPGTVSLVLAAIDRIKLILEQVEELGAEPEGDDADLTDALAAHAEGTPAASAGNTTQAAPAAAALLSAPPAAPPPHAEAGEKPAAQAPRAQQAVAAARPAETIRVTVDTIERIMQLVSELVLTRNQLLEITRHREEDAVKTPLQRLSSLTTDLQDAVMRARMQPVGRLLANLPRLVRELESELDKRIELVTEGADTELDRQLIEALRDPLTHIVRNCADHGIEPPEERVAAGKPRTGEIRISAAHEAGQITIDISDDGRGLDTGKLRKKIISAGLVPEQEALKLADEDVFQWIFEPGISTANKVTSVSGRGVGMDVVRSNIESIGGSVTVFSKPGRGSRFSLNIPLTLAIAPALIIEVADQRFALPQHSVIEAVGLGRGSPHRVETVQNAAVLRLRDDVVPVADLRALLGLGEATAEEAAERLVVIMRVGGKPFGLMVDGVADVQEIVVKPLSASLAHLKAFSGQTILGDGSVVLILDPSGIAMRLGIEKTSERKREAAKQTDSDCDRTRLLVFRAGPGTQKVLQLSLVSRIEMVAGEAIERSDGRYLTLHQGRLMPLVPISPQFEPAGRAHPVLVIAVDGFTMGLIVDEIVDIVEEKLEIQVLSSAPDLVGSAEVRGRPVELIDIAHFVQAARAGAVGRAPFEGHRILLIDDDVFFRDLATPALTASGYRTAVAGTAQEAERHMGKGTRFDAVLVDTRLAQNPDILRLLREHAASAGAPIVGLVRNGTAAAARSAESLGLAAVAGKLDRQAVLDALAAVLEARHDEAFRQAGTHAPEIAA